MAKFEKGQSGNPNGRPPRAVEDAKNSVLAALFDEAAEAKIIRAMIRKAAEGDVAAFRTLMDRKYGKITAPQETDTTMEIVVSYE